MLRLRFLFRVSLCGLLTLGLAASLSAADWPQYRGPDQTGSSAESVTLAWPAGGPKVLWKLPTQNGFSSFAVSGGRVFTQVNRDLGGEAREICLALDAVTGKELWAADVDKGEYMSGGNAGAKGNNGGDGPRSTPTVHDGLVYVFNQNMVLAAFDEKSGRPLWKKDVMADYAGRSIAWRAAASPVIDGDLVFVAGGGAGQSLVAFHKKTGQLAWKAFDEKTTHATPVATTILGRRQVIFFMQSGLLSVDPRDGKELWRFPFKYAVSSAASPVVCGDIVYCSAGYNVGGGACRITKQGDGFSATELWKIAGNQQVPNHWSTPVCKDGYLYGMFSFKKFGTGPLKCVKLATGEVQWEQAGFGAGNVILVGDKLLALTDDGNLVVVEAAPAAYKELARTKAVTGKCWSTPALSDGRIYVRSTKEGACLALNSK
jgi:outer membrane protein assembly factor BamB